MSRNLTANFLAELSKGLVRPVTFVEAEFLTGTERFWSGIGDFSWSGKTWTGVGALGAISPLGESADISAEGVEVSLSGIPQSWVTRARDEVRQGKPLNIWFGWLDAAGAVIADPYLSFSGRIDSARQEEGTELGTCRIVLKVENRLIDLSRAGGIGAARRVSLAAATITHSGLSVFDAAKVANGNYTDTAWGVDSASAGAWLKTDLGSGVAKEFIWARMYALAAGSAASWKLQYSDNDSTWNDAAAGYVAEMLGWKWVRLAANGTHRYWRWYLENAPGAGPEFGEFEFYESEVNRAQLITAANLCDEDVNLLAGGTEDRYTANGTFDLEQRAGDTISSLVQAMAGNLVNVGGEWKIIPGSYIAPTVSLSEDDFRAPLLIEAFRTPKPELFNQVTGTYFSAVNNWQRGNFPAVRNNTYLAEDDGEALAKDIQLPFTTSAATAQRLSKIFLETGRRQIVLRAACKMTGYQVEAGEAVKVSYAREGWADKVFVVQKSQLLSAEDGAPGVDLLLREWDSGIFTWSTADETIPGTAGTPTLPGGTLVGLPTGFVPTAGPVNQLSYVSKCAEAGAGVIAYTWPAHNFPRSDASAAPIAVPASTTMAQPGTASLSQVAGGALGARTYYVLLALVKEKCICGISATVASLAVNANNLLKVTAPTAVAGYDGWVPLVGTIAENNIVTQSTAAPSAPVAFGTDWTEPAGGADTDPSGKTTFSRYTQANAARTGISFWNLAASTTFALYPSLDILNNVVEMTGGLLSAQDATQAVRAARVGNLPIGVALAPATPAVGGSGSGSGGGGGGACFSGDTKVLTPAGPRRMDELHAGDLLLTRRGAVPVQKMYVHDYDGEMRVMHGGGLVTPEHLLVCAEGWERADARFTQQQNWVGPVYNPKNEEEEYILASGIVAHNPMLK